MLKLATELVDPHEVAAQSTDVLDNRTTVMRSLSLLPVEPHWAYGDGKGPEESVWRHARIFLRVESVKRRAGIVVENDVRFFVSSGAPDLLTPDQWFQVVRAHWGVENNNHHTLDTAFARFGRPKRRA